MSQWWGLKTASDETRTVQGPCAQAVSLAISLGVAETFDIDGFPVISSRYYMNGPYGTEADALDAVASPNFYDNATDPADFVCTDGFSEPGSVFVEKYFEANFLLLGIPTSF